MVHRLLHGVLIINSLLSLAVSEAEEEYIAKLQEAFKKANVSEAESLTENLQVSNNIVGESKYFGIHFELYLLYILVGR